ncbi:MULTISPECIES: RNA-binding S4 domain-containing protein [Coprobacillaceae]|uniref:RNA-binding S4 domain-containing protein n=1 Tax=Coprobacillaceae TaxID=2810280 RepID=UPI000E52C33F|nr:MULTISPECIES: RNA-binding S4 domain-containing protein [Coprobacillaceae]RHM60466.1 RNA-binding S4 domain-containing protein [Coprobacillus sp. AF33-1AC]RHS95833.1 RNA-binding S4 domain-containing protein [Erysipelatoclostridium sp. AM42-17]
MKEIQIRDEYITLGQFVKFVGIVGSGLDAKMIINDGLVKVNGEVETRRGRKLYRGDKIQYDKDTYVINED